MTLTNVFLTPFLLKVLAHKNFNINKWQYFIISKWHIFTLLMEKEVFL